MQKRRPDGRQAVKRRAGEARNRPVAAIASPLLWNRLQAVELVFRRIRSGWKGLVMLPGKHRAVLASALMFSCWSSGTGPSLAQPVTAQSIRPVTAGKLAARSAPLRHMVRDHARSAGLPVELVTAVVQVESNFDPRATNAGSFGLMQLQQQTAKRLGYSGSPEGLLDPQVNLELGVRYLAQAYRLAGGDICLTVLKYQRGHDAAAMTGAASAYCSKVRRHMARVAEH